MSLTKAEFVGNRAQLDNKLVESSLIRGEIAVNVLIDTTCLLQVFR